MHKVEQNPVDQITNEDAENLFEQILVKEHFDVMHFHHFMGLPFLFTEKAKENDLQKLLLLCMISGQSVLRLIYTRKKIIQYVADLKDSRNVQNVLLQI